MLELDWDRSHIPIQALTQEKKFSFELDLDP